jgi:hypothetical protein
MRHGGQNDDPTPARTNWLALAAAAVIAMAVGGGGGFVAGGQFGKKYTARELAEVRAAGEAAAREADGLRAERDQLAAQVVAFKAREAEEQQARRPPPPPPVAKAPGKAPEKKKEWTFDEAARAALALADVYGREEQAAMAKRLTPGEVERAKQVLESQRINDVRIIVMPGPNNPVDVLSGLGLKRSAAGYLAAVALNDRRFMKVLKYGWEKVESLRSDEALFEAAVRVGGCSAESLSFAVDMFDRGGKYRPTDPAAATVRPALEHIYGVTADKFR